jgi:hypothetical protein
VACVTGMSQSLEGQNACAACSPGTYANVQGLTVCLMCDEGRYQAATKASVCTVCGQGKLQTGKGATECANCLEGSFSFTTGVTACTACFKGTYQSLQGQLQCTDCGKGFYGEATGQTFCTKCSPGKYGDWMHGIMCPECAAGTYQNQEGASLCELCSEGSYQDGTTMTVCQTCLPGKYQENTGKSFCLSCGAGKYQGSAGASKCEACTACSRGSVWVSGCDGVVNGVCGACPSGKYAPAGETVCTVCPDGKYNMYSGNYACQTCNACTPGKYAQFKCTKTDRADCSYCLQGKFAAGYGNLICETCPTGKYNAQFGTTGCQDCQTCSAGYSRGTTCTPTSNAECTPCPAGTYNPSTTLSECQPCPAGTYQNAQGQTRCLACDECEVGQFLASGCTGTSRGTCAACSVCAATIRECTNTSDAVCGTSCAAGDPTPQRYGWLEDGCRPGNYVWGFDSGLEVRQACRPCPLGWVGWDGVYCERCGVLEEPYYLDRSSCVCKPPAVMNASGACVCPDGHRRLGLMCAPCDKNTYGMGGSCWACGAGNFTADTGQTACEACPLGLYRQASQTDCARCPLDGWYAPERGSSVCRQCDWTCATPGYQWVGECPGDTTGRYSVCKPCAGPPGNSTWSQVATDPISGRALEECAFDCAQGFYHADGGCEKCTIRSCGAGWRHTACTSYSDAHCDTACVNETKPAIHSHWEIGSDCPWACDEGYELQAWGYVMFTVNECILV